MAEGWQLTAAMAGGLILLVVGVLGPLPRVKLAGLVVCGLCFLAFGWRNVPQGNVGPIVVDALGFLACACGVAQQAVNRRG